MWDGTIHFNIYHLLGSAIFTGVIIPVFLWWLGELKKKKAARIPIAEQPTKLRLPNETDFVRLAAFKALETTVGLNDKNTKERIQELMKVTQAAANDMTTTTQELRGNIGDIHEKINKTREDVARVQGQLEILPDAIVGKLVLQLQMAEKKGP